MRATSRAVTPTTKTRKKTAYETLTIARPTSTTLQGTSMQPMASMRDKLGGHFFGGVVYHDAVENERRDIYDGWKFHTSIGFVGENAY